MYKKKILYWEGGKLMIQFECATVFDHLCYSPF